MTLSAAVLASLAATVVLAAVHLLAPRIRTLPGVPERALGSFAGGLAVAYVFLHLLPELAAGQQEVGKLLEDVVEPTPLQESGIFLIAVTGFALI